MRRGVAVLVLAAAASAQDRLAGGRPESDTVSWRFWWELNREAHASFRAPPPSPGLAPEERATIRAGLRSRMVLQVHDELLLEVPAAEVPAVRELLPEVMEGVVTLAVPLRVDVKEGRDWAEV